jgi:hypothetical protein
VFVAYNDRETASLRCIYTPVGLCTKRYVTVNVTDPFCLIQDIPTIILANERHRVSGTSKADARLAVLKDLLLQRSCALQDETPDRTVYRANSGCVNGCMAPYWEVG